MGKYVLFLLLVVIMVLISGCTTHFIPAVSADSMARAIITNDGNSSDAIKIASDFNLTGAVIAGIIGREPSKFYVTTANNMLFIVESIQQNSKKTGSSLIEAQTSPCAELLRELASSRGYYNVYYYTVDRTDATVSEITLCAERDGCHSFKKF